MTTTPAARRAAQLVKEHGLHTVECAFPDTWGALRGKRIPASQFPRVVDHGYTIANAAFIWDMLCTIFQVDFANADTGYPDMVAVPDPDTLRVLPWRPGAGFVMCDCVEVHGREPLVLDTRHVLRQAEEALRRLGYSAVVATELEFYLTDTQWTPLYPDVQCYSIPAGAKIEPVMEDVRRNLEACGIVVEACNTEYGPAQVEINMRYGSPLSVADDTALFKYAVKDIARQHNCRATFMPKPFPGFSGNGTHLHLSLTDDTGANLFAVNDLDAGPLRNSLMRRVLAGLLAHQREITGILSPTINAYKRFEDYSFAPTYVNWGGDNRGVAIRTVLDHGDATRIELRTGSAEANPHLLTAAQLAAVCRGLVDTYPLPDMCAGDAYAPQDAPLMPRTLSEACDALRDGQLLRTAFGDAFHTNVVQLLQHEVDEFNRQVTEWEKTRYMEVC